MAKYNIVVLDYSGNTVSFYTGVEIPKMPLTDDSELIEVWLEQETEHRLSNCSWMSSEEEITVINQ